MLTCRACVCMRAYIPACKGRTEPNARRMQPGDAGGPPQMVCQTKAQTRQLTCVLLVKDAHVGQFTVLWHSA